MSAPTMPRPRSTPPPEQPSAGSAAAAAPSAGSPSDHADDWEYHQLTRSPSETSGRPSTRSRITVGTVPAVRKLFRPITGLGWAAIVLTVVCAVVAYVTAWTEFAVVAVVLAVLLLAASVFLFGRSSYSVRIDMQSARVVAGERATGAVVVTNTGQRRLLPSRIELPVGPTLTSFRVPSLAAGAEHEELFVVPTSRRAVIPIGPASSVRGDPLGLLRRQVRWTGIDDLFVHPVTVRLQGAATGAVKDLEGQPTRDLSSNDVSFHALRMYVPGDDRRYVHWKSSAKTGQLMVRQFEETRRTHLAVAVSLDPSDYTSVAEFELAISAAASLGAQAIREERPVSVCAGSAPLRSSSGRRLLDGFSGVDPQAGAGILPSARFAAASVPNASVAVLVTGSTPDPAAMRQASACFSVGIRVVAVRIDVGASAKMGAIGRLDLATVGALDDLAPALRRMRAA